jgi:hypothetical protein
LRPHDQIFLSPATALLEQLHSMPSVTKVKPAGAWAECHGLVRIWYLKGETHSIQCQTIGVCPPDDNGT